MARDYRNRGFRYMVELDGVPRAAFGYCVGLEEASHPVEYYIGDDEIDLSDLANVTHPAHLILAQGVAFDAMVDAWQRAAAEGEVVPHDGAIIVFDGSGHARRRYHFSAGHPAFFQGVRAVGGSERQIDTLEIDCDTLYVG